MSEAHSIDRIKRTIESEADSIAGEGERLRPASFDAPAVGIVASGGDADEVAGAILRATGAGHQVLVAYDPEHVDREAIEFAERLGVTIVEPTFDRWNGEGPTELLGRTAREYGLPGVISHTDLSTSVDFVASARKLQRGTEYVVAAEPAPAVSGNVGVLVGIPAYDEEPTVGDVVDRALGHGKVLVVDDGSDDGTADAAREAGAVVVEHGSNRGYGAALKTIFAEADRAGADHLVVLDADGQHDPADVPALVEAQEESGAEIVIGSRFVEGSQTELPRYRRFGLHVVNALANLSMGKLRRRSRISDAQSGFRAYDGAAIESLVEDGTIGDDMDASTDILRHCRRRGYAVGEVGTTMDYDVATPSSQHPLAHGLHLVSNLLRTVEYEHPVLILGVPGFVSTMVGVGFAYWAAVNFLGSGVFPLGLAVASVFFVLAGILSAFTAVILHAINQVLVHQRLPSGR